MYDIIGDIHGHYNDLVNLLRALGYNNDSGYFKHRDRKVIFVGDFIDRGINQKKLLNEVMKMVKHGYAIASQGNHELNAIFFSEKNDKGYYLRDHSKENIFQHKAFLDDLTFGSSDYDLVINWFKDLPVFLELDGFRVVHAAWIDESINFLKNNLIDGKLNQDFIRKCWDSQSDEFKHIERALKGLEVVLPDGLTWHDKKNNKIRNTMRVNWFRNVKSKTYKNCAMSFPNPEILPDKEIDFEFDIYSEQIPVFFGHYWLQGKPQIQTDYTACLDYSVAKNGKLVCYRWNGESRLKNENFFHI